MNSEKLEAFLNQRLFSQLQRKIICHPQLINDLQYFDLYDTLQLLNAMMTSFSNKSEEMYFRSEQYPQLLYEKFYLSQKKEIVSIVFRWGEWRGEPSIYILAIGIHD